MSVASYKTLACNTSVASTSRGIIAGDALKHGSNEAVERFRKRGASSGGSASAGRSPGGHRQFVDEHFQAQRARRLYPHDVTFAER